MCIYLHFHCTQCKVTALRFCKHHFGWPPHILKTSLDDQLHVWELLHHSPGNRQGRASFGQ